MSTVMREIRHPAVAGSFYPDDSLVLSKQVRRFVQVARSAQRVVKAPRILIVPHAGYTFSGQTAGYGFAQLTDTSRVILLGVSHHHHFRHATMSGSKYWLTPLGKVPIDQGLRQQFLNEPSIFVVDDRVHGTEHGLEVQIPFLQVVLDDFSMLPILLSHQMSSQIVDRIAQVLAGVMHEQAILVVSSDLSHFPTQSEAHTVDQQTIDAILTMDVSQLQRTIDSQMQERISGLVTCACGAVAIRVGMRLASYLALSQARILHYTNSGETGGDPLRVVGYAAIGFYD